MKKFTLRGLVSFLFMVVVVMASAQQGFQPLKVPAVSHQKGSNPLPVHRCTTMEEMEKAIKNDPTLIEKWRAEGEKQYAAYQQRVAMGTQRGERTEATIIIPIVFHLVDNAANLASISDRDIYEQVELLNKDYGGNKLDEMSDVVPALAAARVGRVPIKFVLAKRDPLGGITNGIERRTNASPDHVAIKANATGGLDAWDVTKYANVWCGTFSGADNGLLGIATFPFTTGQGAQGVVIGLTTLPYASNLGRSYYPNYSEGATLSHELGHYFYLIHTFGDNAACNNNDFGLQAGWPLPTGAGPEGDDTPMEKGTAASNFIFGNPSQSYNDGCAAESFGILYGSYMNYFDDRALFMFSDGQRKRVEGCINLYRPGYLTTDGATAPSAITDAFLVNTTPRGYADKAAFVVTGTPLQAIVRNRGSANLTSVTVNVSIDGGAATSTVFPVSLVPEDQATLSLAPITAAAGFHTYKIYTSAPNGSTDNFLSNDTIYSFVNVHAGATTLPLNQDFTSATFPPTGWQVWNPNGGAANTWTRSATAGFTAAGAAFFDDYNDGEVGTLDELITPVIDLGGATQSTLTFKVAYAPYNSTDVSVWDALEIYVSGDGGKTYRIAYKKSGTALATVAATTSAFTATPATPGSWRSETVNLTPYIVAGQKMVIKFRNVTAFGNNLMIDDIGVSAPSSGLDAQISTIVTPANASTASCSPIIPVVTIKNLGTVVLTSATIGVRLNGTTIGTQSWTGNLAIGASTNVTLTSVPISPITGSNTLKIYTTAPNGGVDVAPANDTATSVFTKNNGASLPLVEGFEGTTFAPAGWTINNPDGATTWVRNATAPAASGIATAYINYYNYSTRDQIDELITPVVDISVTGNKLISFARAYRSYGTPPAAGDRDTLELLLSFNCGATYTSIYKAWGQPNPIGADNHLGTVPSGTGSYTPAGAGDYVSKEIDFTALAGASTSVIAKFKGTNRFGNSIYIDNVNIRRQFDRDLTVQSVSKPGTFECGPFTPTVVVRNAGAAAVSAYNINYTIDGGATTTFAVNTPIAIGATATLTLPSVTLPVGPHTINYFTSAPVSVSGTGDQNTVNDALSKTFTVRNVVAAPVVEGFEAASFPSPGWTIVNPTGVTWVRSAPGHASEHAAYIDNFLGTNAGEIDDILSPAVGVAGADSVIMTFDLAHKYYSTTLTDSIKVIYSSDCGNTFNNVIYNVGDPQLATAGNSTAAYTTPAQSDWATRRVAIGASGVPNGNFTAFIRNVSGFGNGMFVDNINIETLFKRDLQLLSINKPNGVECNGSFTAQATVKNRGIETITAFNVAYTIDGGAPQTTTVTGVSIPRDATRVVDLTPALTGLTGSHIIKVYSFSPVTASGTGDQLTANDTLSKAFGVAGSTVAPLVEGFEGSFPPAGWVVSNPDGGTTWAKAAFGHNSPSSAYVHNFTYTNSGRIDELYSPNVTYTGVDSVTLSFDVAAATGRYPGTNGLQLDTLEVLVTKDCGTTFTSIYKKWGNELQTVNDPNFPQTNNFTPGTDQWRTETIDLSTSTFVPNGPLQLVFRNTNSNGNNIYIDNVNLATRTLPAKLKNEGFLILPNPFQTTFSIWHLQTPTTLRNASVYNSSGQMLWKQEYHGNAPKIIPVDLSRQPAGTYILNLGYDDRNKNTQVKLIKF